VEKTWINYVEASTKVKVSLSVKAIQERDPFPLLRIATDIGGDIFYLLTPLSTVLLEKLTGFQLVKKFPVFYGNRRFITAFTSARHLSLS